jgi:hypothetical protein
MTLGRTLLYILLCIISKKPGNAHCTQLALGFENGDEKHPHFQLRNMSINLITPTSLQKSIFNFYFFGLLSDRAETSIRVHWARV